MPLAKNPVSIGRVGFEGSLTSAEVDSLLSDPQLKVLQASSPVESETWDLLNDKLFSVRHDVDLRVYGFYTSECDLSFLPRLRNLRGFSADCLMQAKGIENVEALENLQRLSVGIYSLENFDFLASLKAENLTELSLGNTKSKKPTLRLVARFNRLKQLRIAGQRKDIDVISMLPAIEWLGLCTISISSMGFLTNSTNLWSLELTLGSASDLSALQGMDGIKNLQLRQVRGLIDLSVLSKMRGLQYLFLQSLPHVRAIPDLSKLKALRRIHLENMKGLQDISALGKAPALEEFLHISARGMEPAQYAELLRNKTLKQLVVGFGSEKKNKTLRDLASRAGINPFRYSPFSFG